ncbi:MAG: LacI family DNA-binding transcriptional regulator [Bifidobacteriaceae bacterium]|nr:LacI family DNA-binding transcriptional regulator [Bifidobacteriaceae bacterium]
MTSPPSRRRGAPRTTLDQIARDAGVSISTVSKVLNGRPGVSPTTRALIETRLAKHRYRPRSANQEGAIELVYIPFGSDWLTDVMEGVCSVARELGVGLTVTRWDDHSGAPRDWLEGVARRQPLGVVSLFATPSADDRRRLANRSIPFVIIDPAGDPGPQVTHIGGQNWAGGLAAAGHLLDLGHRRIAVLTGSGQRLCFPARTSGFRAGLEMAGVPYDPELTRAFDFEKEPGDAHVVALLDLPDPPTGFFAQADVVALSVYREAARRGLRIPHDLSVVGYDDLPLAARVAPPLTTVRQPIREIAKAAARLVAGSASAGPPMEFATELVVRQSTAPPRADRSRRDGRPPGR